MRAQLGRQPLMGALPVAHFARAKQLRDAPYVALTVPEVLAHFGFVGPDEPGAGEALAGACARQLGKRRDATLQAGVDAHALQGIAMPRLAVARIEEHLQPLEDVLREVEVRDEEAMLECPRSSLLLDGIDEQVEVLPDPGVLFCLPQRGEPLQHAARGGLIASGPAWLEVERRRIEALEPQRRSVLGLERAERLEYDRRYAVATLDPGAVFGSVGEWQAQRSYKRHETIEATDARFHVSRVCHTARGPAAGRCNAHAVGPRQASAVSLSAGKQPHSGHRRAVRAGYPILGRATRRRRARLRRATDRRRRVRRGEAHVCSARGAWPETRACHPCMHRGPGGARRPCADAPGDWDPPGGGARAVPQ